MYITILYILFHACQDLYPKSCEMHSRKFIVADIKLTEGTNNRIEMASLTLFVSPERK